MTLHSPLLPSHLGRGASIVAYGDPAAAAGTAQLVETFGDLELEYAALRKACMLLDLPQRGTVIVRGRDRVEFLNRMITQELKDLEPWRWRHSFWLNRKGRIDADLRVTALEDHLRFDLDVHSVAHAIQTLQSYVFAEEISFEDATAPLHRLALHGPASIALLGAAGSGVAGPPPASLGPGEACVIRIGAHDVLVERHDACGEIGLELTCELAGAAEVYETLADAGDASGTARGASGGVRARPGGWHAFNVARVEAGTPLFHIDFGEENLPHETGVLRDRVSFKKGCYLGQEVVARMESLGHPKQRLVALRFQGESDADLPQPVSGANVLDAGDAPKVCGRVTSSTFSPMLGGVPVCFAMVKYANGADGSRLLVSAGESTIRATVQPRLAFYRRAGSV